MKTTKKYDAWHFSSGSLNHGSGLKIEAGEIYSIGKDEKPVLCRSGMHGSIRAIDALRYAPGPIISRVRIWDDVQVGDDKITGRHREVLWVADATNALHRFACWCVRHTPVGDGRTVWDLLPKVSRRAVEVKERWVEGTATDAELDDAASDAAGAAVCDAAWAAACAAASDAAMAAARNAQSEELERVLLRLAPTEH